MRFIGREEESAKIKKAIEADELRTILMYGRRRVGKSELIKHVSKDYADSTIYYECKEVSEKSNVSGLCEVLSDRLNLPKLAFLDLESTLKFIFELSKTRKLILVLDEYPYLKKAVPGIDSILQSLIDAYKDEAKLTFVLLGSYIDIMSSLLEASNPMYGRIDLTIDLKPMDYYDSSLFYPFFSSEDKVRLYAVFGGIPYYNRLIDQIKSVKDNIIELIASDGARLENEIPLCLSAEIKKIVNANEVFAALAKGYFKYGDILSQSHVSSGPTLVDVLDKLLKMELIEKVNPINEENNKKKMSYSISDNLSLFYYRYIFIHSSEMKIMSPESFYAKYIEHDFEEQYVPHLFEKVCKEYLIRQNKAGKIDPVLEKIGKYYYDSPKEHKNGEFDVVSLDSGGYIFYEAKFRKKPIDDATIEEEIKQVDMTGLDCYKYVFIGKEMKVKTKRDDVKFISLDEFYGDFDD